MACSDAARMRRSLSFLVLLVVVTAGDAAAQLARNGAYFEIGGSGIAPTFNYERRVSDLWYGRAGFSVITSESDTDSDTTLVVPLTLTRVNRPAMNHHLELGGGVTIAAGDRQDLFGAELDDEEFSALVLTGLIGYRYQRPGRGFQFRAAFTPAVGGGDFLPWAGVSFGYAW